MADPSLYSSATMPGYQAHALEALCEMSSFLALRFPRLFTVKRNVYDPSDPTTYGDSTAGEEAGAVIAVSNLITGETYNFPEIAAREGADWNPMHIAGCAWLTTSSSRAAQRRC